MPPVGGPLAHPGQVWTAANDQPWLASHNARGGGRANATAVRLGSDSCPGAIIIEFMLAIVERLIDGCLIGGVRSSTGT